MTKIQEKPAGYWRIEQMLDQIGRRALIYIGNSTIVYTCRDDDSKPDSPMWTKGNYGYYVNWEVGVMLSPNFGEKHIKFILALDSNDTYVLFVTRGQKLVHEFRNLYCDDIAGVIESTYDNIIKTEFQGFIPI